MKMRKLKSAGLMALGIMLLPSCATILNDATQQINVTSSNGKPISGTVDGIPFSGPGVVAFKRSKADKVVSVTTNSCTKTTSVNSTVDPKFFINILSGGTFCSTTDYSTEKMWKYQDNVVVSCQ